MKKVSSVAVLVLCSILSTVIVYFSAAFPVAFEQNLYGDNAIVAIALEGALTFLVVKYLMPILVNFSVSKSQKIEISENGMRYKVWGAITVAYYVTNMIRQIIQHSNHLVSYLFAGSLCALYGVLLIIQGGKAASVYTINSGIDTKKKIANQVDPNKNKEAIIYNEHSSTSTHINTSIPKDTLMALKELYDDGVLTEEEYNNKKKELLGL